MTTPQKPITRTELAKYRLASSLFLMIAMVLLLFGASFLWWFDQVALPATTVAMLVFLAAIQNWRIRDHRKINT